MDSVLYVPRLVLFASHVQPEEFVLFVQQVLLETLVLHARMATIIVLMLQPAELVRL